MSESLSTFITINWNSQFVEMSNFIFQSGDKSSNIEIINANEDYISSSKILVESSLDTINKKIDETVAECSEKNWDYYGGLPLSERAVSNAKKFISYIEDFTLPEIIPYPTSDIGFSWKCKENVLNIIFNNKDQIIYVISQNKKVTSGYFNVNNINIVCDIVKGFLQNG